MWERRTGPSNLWHLRKQSCDTRHFPLFDSARLMVGEGLLDRSEPTEASVVVDLTNAFG